MSELLAIETSAEACSVALHIGGETRERFVHAPMRHAELLLPAVQSLLADAGLPLKRLEAIAFGRGPGSFTSLRIGIGVVQGLAWGADLPVVPVSSLAATAQQAADYSSAEHERICVALDARMQEVYFCEFLADGEGIVRRVSEERVCSPAAVGTDPDQPFIAVGNGFERYEELQQLATKASASCVDAWPRAGAIIKLALDWLQSHDPLPPARAQPVYIRNNVAVKPTAD